MSKDFNKTWDSWSFRSTLKDNNYANKNHIHIQLEMYNSLGKSRESKLLETKKRSCESAKWVSIRTTYLSINPKSLSLLVAEITEPLIRSLYSSLNIRMECHKRDTKQSNVTEGESIPIYNIYTHIHIHVYIYMHI